MKINYDPKVDALNVTFKEGKAKKTVELAPEINLDLDSKGRPLYLEIIGAMEKLGRKDLLNVHLKNVKFAGV